MIVDAQVHVWLPDTPDRPWPKGGASRAHVDVPLTYQKILPMMAEAGIDRAVIVPPSWEGERNDHALEAAANHPNRFAVMGRVALNRPELAKTLPRWKEQKGMLGIRLPFNHERRPWITDGTADWFWPVAQEAGIPLMIFAPEAPEAIGQVASRYPNLRMIIDHMGLNLQLRDNGGIGPRIEIVAQHARHPNVAVKLSSVPIHSREPYPFRDMTPHLRKLFDAFGPRRCFWGTDVTHSHGKIPYRQYVTHFSETLDFLSADDKRWVMGEGICEFLNWK